MAGITRKNTLESLSRSVRSMMKKDKDKNVRYYYTKSKSLSTSKTMSLTLF
jgi:hypothetical protein